jgi:caffeoyl-CoA O-methyltransferase
VSRPRNDWVFQTGCFAPGFTRNDQGTACPCLLPPLAVKSKPPAVRVVVDSQISFLQTNQLKIGDVRVEQNQNSLIETYIAEHTDDVSPLLQDLLKETETITGRSRWSIGKVEGRLMQFLLRASGARSAVEIGTFTGFSALMIAEALPEDGLLITCEFSSDCAEIARRYFKKSPHGRKIRLELKPAIETLKEISDNSVDFVFIDADKPSYGLYFDEALRILRPGGLVFVDNVFWRNKIFKKPISNQNAKAIAAFNRKVKNTDGIDKVMLSVRDGIYLIRKR